MAEDSAAAKQAAGGGKDDKGGKPIILYALVILNMLVVVGVGVMMYMSRQKDQQNAQAIDKAAQGIAQDKAAAGEHGEAGHAEAGHGEAGAHGEAEGHGEHSAAESDEFVGKMIPLETFLVNLAGNRGNKLIKINMELEVEGAKIGEEIDKRKPQIRDIIIILLSSKTYAQLSAAEGKEFLRDEIRDTVNSFLKKGKIKRVHFTEFIFN